MKHSCFLQIRSAYLLDGENIFAFLTLLAAFVFVMKNSKWAESYQALF